MKISIVTFGTRGDVQPYIALAFALKQSGHEMLLAAPKNFGEWIRGHQVEFESLGTDMEALLRSPETQRLLAGQWWKIFSLWRKTIVPFVQESLDAIFAAAGKADVIIYHPRTVGASDVAEATGALAICATPLPMAATREFPIWAFKTNFGPALNRLSWQALRLARLPFASMINRWRKQVLKLDAASTYAPIGMPTAETVHLCGISPCESLHRCMPSERQPIDRRKRMGRPTRRWGRRCGVEECNGHR